VKRVAVLALAALVVAGACKKKNETAANLNAANKVAVRRILLFYETPQMLLGGEPRNVAVPESAAAAIPIVLRELVKGPAAPTSLRLFPADTVVRGAYLLPEGTVVVDLGGKTLTDGWGTGSHQELMAVYSVVQSVTGNFPDAKRVRIVINGTPAETLAGHVSLARSLGPAPQLVDPRAR
jgi:spore germination protein GerM